MFIVRTVLYVMIGLVSAATPSLFAQGGSGDATSLPASGAMCITPVGKEAIVARIRSWELPGVLELDAGAGRTERMDSGDVDQVRGVEGCKRPDGQDRRSAMTPARAAEWMVQLADGSQVIGAIAGGDDERLTLHHAELGEMTLPIERIARLWKAVGREPSVAGDEDVVELTNGDRVRGAVAGVSAGALRWSDGGEERPLPWSKVQSVALATAKGGKSGGVSAIVGLHDGSRIVASKLDWKDGQIHLQWTADARLSVPLETLSCVEVSGGRRAWLSGQPPENYEAVPYLETRWAYQVDKNALGGPLKMQGATYRRGLGLHSACKMSWRLGGAYERFTALVGIDDSAGRLADADVTILLDGKELAALRGLRCNEEPRSIDVPVLGVDRLTIEIGFGKRGDVQDRVDVVNPALLRKS